MRKLELYHLDEEGHAEAIIEMEGLKERITHLSQRRPYTIFPMIHDDSSLVVWKDDEGVTQYALLNVR